MKAIRASRPLLATLAAVFLFLAACFPEHGRTVEITEQKLMELSEKSGEVREAVKRFEASLRKAIEKHSESVVMPEVAVLMPMMGDMVDQRRNDGDGEAEAYAAAIVFGSEVIEGLFPDAGAAASRGAGDTRDVVGVWRLAKIVGLPPEKVAGLVGLGFAADGTAPPGGSDLAVFEFREDGTVSGQLEGYEQEYVYEAAPGLVILSLDGRIEIKMRRHRDGTMEFPVRNGPTLFIARADGPSGAGAARGGIEGIPLADAGLFMIENKLSGLYADIRGGSKDKGANLLIWNRNDKPNQQFQVINYGGGFYGFAAVHSGMYLNPADNKGGPLVQNENDYLWQVEMQDDGWYKIIDPATSLCWDVKGNSKQPGASVVSWSVKNGKDDNQKFRFVETTAGR